MKAEVNLIVVKYYTILVLVTSTFMAGAQSFQLASPQIDFDNQLFHITTEISVEFDLPGSAMHYTLDGSEPTIKSRMYTEPVIIIENAVFKIRVFHPDFLPSDTESVSFVEISDQKHFTNVSLGAIPNPQYEGKGFMTINDSKRGSSNFQDGNWLGFKGKAVSMEVELDEAINEGGFYIGLMKNAGAWIFGPRAIYLYGFSTQEKSYLLLASKDAEEAAEHEKPALDLEELSFTSKEPIIRFKLTLDNYKDIPSWHPGTSENVWIFIDEIILK